MAEDKASSRSHGKAAVGVRGDTRPRIAGSPFPGRPRFKENHENRRPVAIEYRNDDPGYKMNGGYKDGREIDFN